MNHDEAMAHVARMGVAVQKVRSNMTESDLADVSAMLCPWFYGDRNILRAIEIVQARGYMAPAEFYNLMWVASQVQESALLYVWFAVHDEPQLPEPDLNWLREDWSAST